MEYKVVSPFKEKAHNDHIYNEGDLYPAEGFKLNQKRAAQLQEVHPEYGVSFLEKVKDSTPEKAKKKEGEK